MASETSKKPLHATDTLRTRRMNDVKMNATFENSASVRIAACHGSRLPGDPGTASLQTTALPSTKNAETPNAFPANEPTGAGIRRLATRAVHASQNSDRRETNDGAAIVSAMNFSRTPCTSARQKASSCPALW